MIEVNKLQKKYGDIEILKDVTFTVEEGRIFGIIGHSGAGKSTLLRCINGLETYDGGSLRVMGKEISNLKQQELREFRKSVGMIFQSFNLLKRSSVQENTALPLKLWKYDKSYINNRVDELLELVGLSHKKKSMPRELSGGEKQRVAIARALALKPKILLCDEATSALDPKITKDILSLLDKINKELKITIVMVTHQMEVIKEVCEEAVLIDEGKIMGGGTVEELFLRPGKPLKKFLGIVGEEELVSNNGVNIRIFFPPDCSQDAVITKMARELDIDFSIVCGKLEKFRNNILGSLVIQIEEENVEKVTSFLDKNKNPWEVM